jgi:hypothetical protein
MFAASQGAHAAGSSLYLRHAHAGLGDPLQLASEIRAEIEAATGCTGAW